MIRRCEDTDFEQIWSIINDGAEAYRGIIPADRWTEPYMSRDKLQQEIQSGVEFWTFDQDETQFGVMGIQKVDDVTLIRHAYVRTPRRRLGVGGQLLAHMLTLATGPILIGTWADAVWAIRFYERYGFQQVISVDKEHLLRRYWTVPERQIETSIVLADEQWRRSR